MSFRAPRPAGCRVLWLKAEPEAAGIPGSALHRSPGMAEAALAHLELSPTRSTAAVGGERSVEGWWEVVVVVWG